MKATLKALLLALALLLPAGLAAAEDSGQERVPLTIETVSGVRHQFQVEIADTEAEREKGLMFRREMAPDHGMLFIFDRPIRVMMWMKNTPLPLDMLFIDGSGKIVDLHERAIPFSLDTIAARRKASYVLEINGGTVDRLGLAIGDRVSGAGIGG